MKSIRKIVSIPRGQDRWEGFSIVTDSKGVKWRLESSGTSLEEVESDLNRKFKQEEFSWKEFGKIV